MKDKNNENTSLSNFIQEVLTTYPKYSGGGIPHTMSTDDFVALLSDFFDDNVKQKGLEYLTENDYPYKTIDNEIVWLVQKVV